LREGLLDKTNTASTVWADTAYRSKANEDFMDKEGFVSKVHRKKAASQTDAPAYPEIECWKVGGPISCRARLCRSEIADWSVYPNRGYHPSHHEDRTSQYCLQHAPLSLPGADQRERVAIQGGGPSPICSKRRAKTNPKVINQIAKSQKLPAKHIHQRFFDPSTFNR